MKYHVKSMYIIHEKTCTVNTMFCVKYMKNHVIDYEWKMMYYIHMIGGVEMLVYKIDVLSSLKEAGYNTTRLRKEKLLNESAIQYIREGKPVGAKALDNICMLLDMQPGNIIKYVEETHELWCIYIQWK